MREEPMGDKNDYCKGAELPYSSTGKCSYYAKNRVVEDDFERVGSPCITQSFRYPLLHGQGNMRLANSIDLFAL